MQPGSGHPAHVGAGRGGAEPALRGVERGTNVVGQIDGDEAAHRYFSA